VKEYDDAIRPHGVVSMFWFQDLESARALARLCSESPHMPCGDAVPQSHPDLLPLPGPAAPLIDAPDVDDALFSVALAALPDRTIYDASCDSALGHRRGVWLATTTINEVSQSS
jgi:hypothetical protein